MFKRLFGMRLAHQVSKPIFVSNYMTLIDLSNSYRLQFPFHRSRLYYRTLRLL